MKSKIVRASVFIFCCVILIVSLIGCSRNNTLPASSVLPSATAPVTPSSAAPVSVSPISTASPGLSMRSINDMYGRNLTVPKTINRVLTSGPIEMEMVYLLAPDKLAGLSFSFNGKPALVQQKYLGLPVIGGWFGTQTGNYETFLAAGPDIILEGTKANLPERQEKFGPIPVVGVYAGDKLSNYDDDALTGYEDEIIFLGELLDVQAQSTSLNAYYQEAMDYVKKIVSAIPEEDKVRVYYAEGKEGFSTDPVGSMHTRLLEFCGGINVAQVALKPGFGMADVSLEQIILWDPDMIIIGRGSQPALYNTIMTDSRWRQLRAVQNKQVAIRPDNPFSWFDGPPGPCQIVGMYWMINKLYPEQTRDLDLNSKVKEFYSEFLHYNLNDQELMNLLANPE